MIYKVYVAGTESTKVYVEKIVCEAARPCVAILYSPETISEGTDIRIDLPTGDIDNPVYRTYFNGIVIRNVDRTAGYGGLYEITAVSRLERLYNGFIDVNTNTDMDTFLNSLVDGTYLNKGPGDTSGETIDGLGYQNNKDMESMNINIKYAGEVTVLAQQFYRYGQITLLTIPTSTGEKLLGAKKTYKPWDAINNENGIAEVVGETQEGVYNGVYIRAWSKAKEYEQQVSSAGSTIQLDYIPVQGSLRVYVADDAWTPQYELCYGVDYTYEQIPDAEKPPVLSLDSKYVGMNILLKYMAKKFYKYKLKSDTVTLAGGDRYKVVILKEYSTIDNIETDVQNYAQKLLDELTRVKKEIHFYQPHAFNTSNGYKWNPVIGTALTITQPDDTTVDVYGLFAGIDIEYYESAGATAKTLHIKRIEWTAKKGIKLILKPVGSYTGLEDIIVTQSFKITKAETVTESNWGEGWYVEPT